MGIGPGSRNCPSAFYDPAPAPNPNPKRFEMLATVDINMHVVAKIRYFNCTNFEGVKICLFLNICRNDLIFAKEIDPHFAEDGLTPFARFRPDENGWDAAILLAQQIGN